MKVASNDANDHDRTGVVRGARHVIGEVLAEYMPEGDVGFVTDRILDALREARFTVLVPNPLTSWLLEDGPDPAPGLVAKWQRMIAEERAAGARPTVDPAS